MKLFRRWQRNLILGLLLFTFGAQVILVSHRPKHVSSTGRKEFIEDLSTIKYKRDTEKLNVVEQDYDEGLKEPLTVLYKDGDIDNVISFNSTTEASNFEETITVGQKNAIKHLRLEENRQNSSTSTLIAKEHANQTDNSREQNAKSQPRKLDDEKVKQIKDQVIRANAYLKFPPPNSNSRFVRDLKLRIKELERAAGEATKDSDLSRSAIQRMRAMEASLFKASRTYSDCSAMAIKLRAMTYNAEEQVRAHQNQATYLVKLAGRTTPKGLHCLSMQLTAEYFALLSGERETPHQNRLQNPDLYHYAVFSDNVLACAVVVNSTVSTAKDSEKIVFHVVTDSLNFPAISMWFLLNPPGNATIQIQNIDEFEKLSKKYGSTLKQKSTHDPTYSSALNHLRFYLPEVFPKLNKIVFLDHDVVVQRDLTGLWSVDMNGKVNGAVETCSKGESSFRQMDMFINFADPLVANKFDVDACTWAFGMNLFDLQEWRNRNLTGIYQKYLHLGHYRRQLWKDGSLPLGWVTFYNETVALDKRCHLLGLGYDSDVSRASIDRAAVIHYDGLMKPWLEIGIRKYKGYWSKHVNYNHPFLQQCNIHP